MKTRSGERLSFFTDVNIAHRLTEMLRIYAEHSCTFIAHRERFKPDAPDDEWLGEVATWIPRPSIVCGDGRILKNPALLAALREVRTHFIVPVEGYVNLGFRQQVIKMISVWDEVEKACKNAKEPAIFKIRMKPDVQFVCTLREHRCSSERRRDRHRRGEAT